MNYDQFGRTYTTSNELAELLYYNPTVDLSKFFVTDTDQYNDSVGRVFYADMPILNKYVPLNLSPEEFDHSLQSKWHMPLEYQNLDIAQWLLEQCKDQSELQRVGEELLLYQDRDLFNLLRYLKYMVDTFRKNNIVWGLGRGSSVASYVLYLLGVHKINSMYYDLDISEFLR
jgi:hypothetical protein